MNQDLKATYNRIAADWFKDHNQDTWWIEGTDSFISLLQPGASVLDVGCGGGVKSKYLLEKGLQVTGIDFSENMIKIAKDFVPAAKFSVADITKPLDFPELFDGIFAQAVLLHIPKKEIGGVLKNVIKVLKPEGYLYVAVKSPNPGQKEEEIVKENDYGYEYERFFSFYTLEEMLDHLKECGMTIVHDQVNRTGHTDWVQIIAKK